MPQIGWVWEGINWTHEELMELASTYPSYLPYTPEMLSAMFNGTERDFVSPTLLSSCIRQAVLKREVDYYIEPDKLYPSYRGGLLHSIMENGINEPDALIEQRFSINILLPDGSNKVLSGQPDKVVPSKRLLIDYKTVQDVTYTPKEHWIWQLSIYRWILAKNNIVIDRAIIQQISMRVPARIEIPLKSLEETEEYIMERMINFNGVFDGTYHLNNLPPMLDPVLEPEEVFWLCKSKDKVGGGWCPVRDICFEMNRRDTNEPIYEEETI